MDRILLINFLTLIAIGLMVYWKISDPRPRTERIKSYFKADSVSIGIFSFVFYVCNYVSGMYFPLPRSAFDNTISLIGIIIFLAGVGICIWAKKTMGHVWAPPANHNIKRQNKLIKTGPFHYSRNPIYVGLVMVLIGYPLAIQSYFLLLSIIPILYFYKSVFKEEKLLEEHFGKEYLEYKKQVPRFF